AMLKLRYRFSDTDVADVERPRLGQCRAPEWGSIRGLLKIKRENASYFSTIWRQRAATGIILDFIGVSLRLLCADFLFGFRVTLSHMILPPLWLP
ncbi:MAG: hypothetical protein WA866_09745, partial [Pseudolabrys sp.]